MEISFGHSFHSVDGEQNAKNGRKRTSKKTFNL